MTTTSIEEYTVDGTGLNTYAWNLSTFSGRSGVPEAVGPNRDVFGRPGQEWQRKQFGPRTESWAMWVLGCNEDGGFPTEYSRRAQYNENLEALKRLFGVRHRQLELTKTVVLPDGPEVRTGLGEVVGAWDPEVMAGATRAVFSVDMFMADPFWYGPEVEASIEDTETELDHPGSAIAVDMTLVFEGPLTRPRLRNLTTNVEVRLDLVLNEGQTVTLDTSRFTALSGGNVNVIAAVSQLGSDRWMEIVPGENTLIVDNWTGGAVGAGSVEIKFLPPYL